jgi:hypothetical protein
MDHKSAALFGGAKRNYYGAKDVAKERLRYYGKPLLSVSLNASLMIHTYAMEQCFLQRTHNAKLASTKCAYSDKVPCSETILVRSDDR